MSANAIDVDGFHVAELYLLASIFNAEVLFGLPDKKVYQLRGEDPFKRAHQGLIDKGILTKDGKMTKNGVVIIKTLKDYFLSEKYVRINNLMFAFRKKEDQEVIILVEKEEETNYQLYVVAKPLVLKMLMEKLAIFRREPMENEKSFLQKELSLQEQIEVEEMDPDQSMINLEFFHLDKEPQTSKNRDYYQQWFSLIDQNDRLIMVNTQEKKYYHASQYWFLKKVFDELDFPYQQKEAQ